MDRDTAGDAVIPTIAWPDVERPDDLARIVHWDAAELSAAIRGGAVTCTEVMAAYLDHIDRVNPQVNAIVLLRDRDVLMAEAAEKDALLAAGICHGWMHGFPWAVKDLEDAAGLVTTFGFFQPDEVPPAAHDSLLVARLKAAGVIVVGKTNTPEFGIGSQTYNTVFGTTGNAWDPTRTSGGSSGGAAVAVALHLVPAADGSDFMGSLRNPPGWNNVYGLRPSFGRVPTGADGDVFVSQGGVAGPIARTPRDLALLLGTMSGYDATTPLSLPGPPLDAAEALAAPVAGRRVAWLGDLGGYLPMEPDVLAVTRAARPHLEAIGLTVTDVEGLPSWGTFRGNDDLWPTWLIYRHWLLGTALKPLHDDPRLGPRLKPEARYEIDGLLHGADGNPPLSGADVHAGSVKRSDLYQAFRVLFESYDYAVLPTAQVMPFDASVHWPTSIAGVPMTTYHRWMEVTTIGTLINAPTLAMPAGFSADGLPIGLQVIGRNHDDASLLALAAAWERQTGFSTRHLPPLIA